MVHDEPRLLVVADDLSGAAETAATFGCDAALTLWPHVHVDTAPVTVVDLDTRVQTPAAAARRTHAMLDARDAASDLVLKKIDSLLRGAIVAEVGALRDDTTTVLVCPALPEQGRVVRDGVLYVDGVALHETAMWRLESSPPPHSVAEALAPLDTHELGLDVVRGPNLLETLRAHRGEVLVPDAETTADLTALVRVVRTLPGCLLVGSAALFRALADELGVRNRTADSAAGTSAVPEPPHEATTRSTSPATRQTQPTCLTVVGTAAETAREQVERLIGATDATEFRLAPRRLARLDRAEAELLGIALGRALETGDAVLTVAPQSSDAGDALVAALSDMVAAAGTHLESISSTAPDLLLTGGATARGVLTRLGIHRLSILAEVHPGAVVEQVGPRLTATRPGSHGGPDSLIRMRTALTEHRAAMPRHTPHPVPS